MLMALIWVLASLLLAMWTAASWAFGALLSWALQHAGKLGELSVPNAKLPMPEWLAPWLPAGTTEWVGPLLEQAAQGAVWLAGQAPLLVNWLTPAIWILWGLGVLVLLTGAVAASWFVRRFGPPTERSFRT